MVRPGATYPTKRLSAPIDRMETAGARRGITKRDSTVKRYEWIPQSPFNNGELVPDETGDYYSAADVDDYLAEREQRVRELVALAEGLLDKLDDVTQSESYKGVFFSAHIHGVNYIGPTFEQECAALRALLDAFDKDVA